MTSDGEQPAVATENAPEAFGASFMLSAQGHALTIYSGGRQRLEALLGLIDAAREELCLCFYIFAADKSGRMVRDALTRAAERGVTVKLYVDGFGTRTSTLFFQPMIDAGASFSRFSPKFGRRYLIRNHQKLALADRQKAIIGGFNIADGYFTDTAKTGWRDLGIKIEGPVVQELRRWFSHLETLADKPNAPFLLVRKIVRDWDPGDGPVQLLIGGPTVRWSSWPRTIIRDLRNASRLDMVMAYFSPAFGLIKRIGAIARRGNARLVMAGKSDNSATIAATRSLYKYLLKRGAQVYEYDSAKLHAKLIIVDDCVYIGSANFDMRSLYINLELMVRIKDARLAADMRSFIDRYLPDSDLITAEAHRRKATLLNRLRWGLSWTLVATLDYSISRRLNLGP